MDHSDHLQFGRVDQLDPSGNLISWGDVGLTIRAEQESSNSTGSNDGQVRKEQPAKSLGARITEATHRAHHDLSDLEVDEILSGSPLGFKCPGCGEKLFYVPVRNRVECPNRDYSNPW